MKVLLVWTNKDQFGYKPISISLFIPLLRARGHEVDLFDTSFIDFGYKDNTEDRRRIRIFKQVDWSGYDLSKKKTTIEAELTKKLDEFRPDIVAVSALTDEIAIGMEVSRITKQWNQDTIVIWGNKAATMSPHKILYDENIDYLCIGEGIEFLPEFVDCIARGNDPRYIQNIAYRAGGCSIRENPLRPYFQDLDSLPFLNWSLFDKRHLLKPFDGKVLWGGDYMISWGCPNNCTYCINKPIRELYGSKAGKYLRRHSVDRAISELKFLKETWDLELIIFHDEDFTLKPMDYFEELASQYHKHVNVPFTGMVNARNIDEDIVALLKEMNCLSVSIGVETGNNFLREHILRRRETKEEIVSACKLLNSAGIRTSTFNMLGIPFETRNTIMETIALNRAAEPRFPNNVYFFPYEGTELAEVAIKNKMFDPNSGAVYEQDKPALTLPSIPTEELIALRERFVLYVKMPEEYHEFIKRSEQNDEVGRKLTEALYNIYDACVLEHNGIWNDGGSDEYLRELYTIWTGHLSTVYKNQTAAVKE